MALPTTSNVTTNPTNSVTISNSVEYWLRLNLIEDQCLTPAVNDIMHNRQGDTRFQGLPEDGIQLFNEMNQFRQSAEGVNLKNKKTIKDYQWVKLCPPSGTSNSKDWDIPLMRFPIQYSTNLPPPVGGWRIQIPSLLDVTKAANVYRASDLRNEIKHNRSLKYSREEFDDVLARAEYILIGLDYRNMRLFEDLKTISLEVNTRELVAIVKADLENKVNDAKCKINEANRNVNLNNVKIQALRNDVVIIQNWMTQFQETINMELGHLQFLQSSLSAELRSQIESIRELNGRVEEMERRQEISEKRLTENEKQIQINKNKLVEQQKSHVSLEEKHAQQAQGLGVLQKRVTKLETGAEKNADLCNQVWKVMYESDELFLLEDWKELANLLDVQYLSQFHDMEIIWNNGEEKEIIKDELQKVNITWKQLKNLLCTMNKNNMIVELRKKTNLTSGLDNLIKQHKDHISKETSQRTSHGKYVDLVIVESQIIDRRWRDDIDEQTFHTMKFTIPPSDFPKITTNELLSNKEKGNVTIITGIPGIGKTTLVEEIKYQWSNNNLWDGEIDLFLTIECRVLNMYNFSSTTDLFKQLLPKLQDIELLNEISDRVLLILDGADEFKNIEELSANPHLPNLQFFKELIDQPNQQLFSKLIITSRPMVAALVRKFYKEDTINCPVQPVEICGFNDENVESFVQKQFQDEGVVDTVMRIVETNTMKAMSSVPFFIKFFCEVYKEDSEITTPSTMTELLLYTLLTFFKKLYKLDGNPRKNLSFKQLSSDKAVVEHILNLSVISHKTLAERKVVFYEEDFECEILNELEKVGFLSKKTHEVEGFIYEYKHLMLHEVLAALRILSMDSENKRGHYDNPNFRDTLPLVSGLEGISNRSDVPKYLKTLVQKVTGFELVESPRVKSFLEEQLMKKFDKELFEITYLFAQNEDMEIPTEEFIAQVLTKQNFDLQKETVVRSQFIKFFTFLLPYVQYFEKVDLEIHLSDDVQQLVDISRKTKVLFLKLNHDKKWMNYFKLKKDEKWIEYLKKLSQPVDQGFHVKVRGPLKELHLIGELFKYVSSVHIIGQCNKIIHKYMNENNKLEVLKFDYFPELSLEHLACLKQVTVSCYDFTVAKGEHMNKEMEKVKNNKERNLEAVELIFKVKAKKDFIKSFKSFKSVSDIRINGNRWTITFKFPNA